MHGDILGMVIVQLVIAIAATVLYVDNRRRSSSE